MFDINEYNALARGDERMDYLKKCIDAADKEQCYGDALMFRHMYIEESVFHGDCFKAILMFPEYMKLFSEHQDLHDKRDFMFAFKWILEDCIEFYQIDMENVEKYYEEFKRYCMMLGYSERVYYLKRVILYSYSDPGKAAEMREKFLKCDRDEISDCAACETSADIRFELEFGSTVKAVRMFNEMLDKGISCSEVPETTFGYFVKHFTGTGNIKEAEHYADMLLPLVNNNVKFMQEISAVILLKTITDPMAAYNLINRHIGEFENIKNTLLRFDFADAAARFFDAALKNGNEKLSMRLPHSMPMYDSDGIYETAKLRDYFADIANDIAAKMDARNGSSYFTDLRNYEYPTKPAKKLELPMHGSVAADPLYFGVPYDAPENVPSPMAVLEAFEKIDGIVNSAITADEEKRVITITGTSEECGGDVVFRIAVVQSAAYEKMNLMHEPFEVEGGVPSEAYPEMLLINYRLNKNFEGKCLLILYKLICLLNENGAPFAANLTTSTLLSMDWIRLYADHDMLPPEKYMFTIQGEMSSRVPDAVNGYTIGLATFCSRDVMIPDLADNRTGFAASVLNQYAKSVIGVMDLRDEGIKVNMGITFNGEPVMCSWVDYWKNFGEGEKPEGMPEFAVPVFYLPNDPDKGVYVQDIPTEMYGDFDFMTSGYSRRINEVSANRTIDIAEKAYYSGCQELIVGFDVDTPEQLREEIGDMFTVYAKATVGGYIIDSASAEVEGYAVGDVIPLRRETVFFWRLEKNGDYFFPDEAYLL